jgi:uncharacterized protein YbjT (DUF2867 family)
VIRLCLVGATGLVGYSLIERAVSRSDMRIIGVARREIALPCGARMEMLLADPSGWPDAIAAANAQVMVCALGSTMAKVGKDPVAFREVDHELVVACARAAKAAGIEHFILVSSIGADLLAKSFYLRVKAGAEEALGRMRFHRLDILRPGLIRGQRKESRPLERMAVWLSPAFDLFLRGKFRKYHSIRAEMLADAIFALSQQKARGRFVHDFGAMQYVIRRVGDSPSAGVDSAVGHDQSQTRR